MYQKTQETTTLTTEALQLAVSSASPHAMLYRTHFLSSHETMDKTNPEETTRKGMVRKVTTKNVNRDLFLKIVI